MEGEREGYGWKERGVREGRKNKEGVGKRGK